MNFIYVPLMIIYRALISNRVRIGCALSSDQAACVVSSDLGLFVGGIRLLFLLSLTSSLGSATFCMFADFLLFVCVGDLADVRAELLLILASELVLRDQLFGEWLLIIEVSIAPVWHLFLATSALSTVTLAIGTVSLHLLLTRIFLQSL